MNSNLEKYKKDIDSLIKQGREIYDELYTAVGKIQPEEEPSTPKFFSHYQNWYTEAHAIISQLLLSRISEFESLYHPNIKRKKIDVTTYSIQDWLLGVRSNVNDYTRKKHFHDAGVIVMRFHTQLKILKAVQKRFESSLFDIKQLVQADLFDSELDSAKELNKKGFGRGAGAVAGVVLEKHLSQVCESHGIKVSKNNPGISDYNQLLKEKDVVEIKDWRFIQRLADLRNLCDHNKETEPTKQEIKELIEGVDKITKTLF